MIKYCLDKWNENHKRLEEVLASDTTLNSCDYQYLVELVVEHILNGCEGVCCGKWDKEHITRVDDGDYQGTLLFLIPKKTYQPSEYEYLMTYAGYGSCSGCDALKAIQEWGEKPPEDWQIEDFMALCKDLVTNMVKPYNNGWRYEEEFETVTMEAHDDRT